MEKMGNKFTEKEITRMIRSVDRDGNGLISIDEFSELLDEAC